MNSRAWRVGWIAWPAFVVAGLLEVVVFAFVDPAELHTLGGEPLALSPAAVHTLAFLVFWALAALGGWLTVTLARPSAEINRGPPLEDGPR